jgi:tRNA pseudouridine38-40 synthase
MVKESASQRMLIRVEYDGTGLVGWQRQENGLSVQQFLEQAAEKLTTRPTLVQGAGRTDAGVHALGQAAHLDVPAHLDSRAVLGGMNSWLEDRRIAVLSAQPVAADFHARFDALARHYLYRLGLRAVPGGLLRDRVWQLGRPLQLAAMQEAAACLEGRHDFTSFRAAACQADSPVRTLDRLAVTASQDEIHITVSARSFLHHQVRNITGSLVQVGLGKWPPQKMAAVLAARDRRQAGQTAPPQGLYLTAVDYPEGAVSSAAG